MEIVRIQSHGIHHLVLMNIYYIGKIKAAMVAAMAAAMAAVMAAEMQMLI